jgi:hypothetical protein
MNRECEAPHDQPQPATGHTRLCTPCRNGIRRDLRAITRLDPAITAALIPLNRPGHPQGRSGGYPIPVNLDAAEWRDQAAHDLAKITAWIRDDRGITRTPRRAIADMARWIIPHTRWIAFRDWAPGTAETLAALRKRGQQITAWQPGARALIPLPGPYNTCPECAQPAALKAVMYPLPGDPRECTVRCTGCGHAWEPAQWVRLGQRLTRTVTP